MWAGRWRLVLPVGRLHRHRGGIPLRIHVMLLLIRRRIWLIKYVR